MAVVALYSSCSYGMIVIEFYPRLGKNPDVWRNAKGKKGMRLPSGSWEDSCRDKWAKRNLIIAYRRSPTELLRLNFYSWSATSFAFTRVAVVSNPSWLASKMSPLPATRFMLLVLSSEYVLVSSELRTAGGLSLLVLSISYANSKKNPERLAWHKIYPYRNAVYVTSTTSI
jgi:hypothetical protein